MRTHKKTLVTILFLNCFFFISAQTDPLPISLSIEHPNEDTSEGCISGAIDLTVDSNPSSYSVEWHYSSDNTDFSFMSNDEDIGDLLPGYYQIIIEDDDCNFINSTVELYCICSCSIDKVVTKENCSDGDGTAEIGLSCSYPDEIASILWDDGSSELFRNDLKAGKYTFTLTTELGCRYVESIDVEKVALASGSILRYYSDYKICEGADNGRVNVSLWKAEDYYGCNGNLEIYNNSGSIVYSNYGFIVADLEFTAENLEVGTYTIEVEMCGCKFTAKVEVEAEWVLSKPTKQSRILYDSDYAGVAVECLNELVCNQDHSFVYGTEWVETPRVQDETCCGEYSWSCDGDRIVRKIVKREWWRAGEVRALENCTGIQDWDNMGDCRKIRICPDDLCCGTATGPSIIGDWNTSNNSWTV